MRVRINYYVALIASLAIGVTFFVYGRSPAVSEGEVAAIVLLGVLAAVAEALAFLLPMGAVGSIAFIPYFSAILVAPSWLALLAIGFVRFLADVAAKRPAIKITFNAAQHVVFLGAGVLAYTSLGGVGLLQLRNATLLEATKQVGVQAVAAFALCYILNGILLCVVIAITQRTNVFKVWRTTSLPTLWLDLISVPLVFVFAWVYSSFGPIAASALWVPILGLRQVHKINLELERTNEELLELMVKSMEARDPYTSGHSRRVQHYSTIIARAVGLAEREISLISRAALLHDVGKIHEKYGPILAKGAGLSSEEWAVIQEHPLDGANLVATMSRLRELVGPIRNHHENWDGTGYPDGLAGELIPLPARIIRFADTIDAMTTDRPYRQMMGEFEVRAELVRCRGHQFDPAITDKLLSSPLWSQLFVSGEVAANVRRPKLAVLHAAKTVRA